MKTATKIFLARLIKILLACLAIYLWVLCVFVLASESTYVTNEMAAVSTGLFFVYIVFRFYRPSPSAVARAKSIASYACFFLLLGVGVYLITDGIGSSGGGRGGHGGGGGLEPLPISIGTCCLVGCALIARKLVRRKQ